MDAALKAGVTADRKLKVFAVEKNANAVITLRNRAIMDKWTNVTIVAKDMRDWVRKGMDMDALKTPARALFFRSFCFFDFFCRLGASRHGRGLRGGGFPHVHHQLASFGLAGFGV